MNNIHMSLAITKLKQQIANLQNQIAAQQALYVKQQAGGGGAGSGGGVGGGGGGGGGAGGGNHNLGGGNANVGIGAAIGISNAGVGPTANDYLRGQHDPINTLQGTFSDMSMSKVYSTKALPSRSSNKVHSCISSILLMFVIRSSQTASKIQVVNSHV